MSTATRRKSDQHPAVRQLHEQRLPQLEKLRGMSAALNRRVEDLRTSITTPPPPADPRREDDDEPEIEIVDIVDLGDD